MSQTPTCPKCGTPLPPDAPAGLCPKCLVQAGFESGSPSQPEIAATSASPPSSGFAPPAVEELAKRFPQLEILELLGKGGMGAVYKARQPGLDRLVAVKILPTEIGQDPMFAERFTREARALARLSHPNIVGVYDFGQADGLYYFVMEYVDGVNLRQAIQANKMSPQNALTIVPQICDALQFAHDEGIVHRDIKPENILIDKKGRVKIADFGLAKLLGREQADPMLTRTQQVMGTLRYMAPEQMEGSHEVDHRADIYSLGVVFYELLTGELPIGRFAPPSKKVEIDVRLDEVVLRALEKEPEQRYQHASDLRTSVEQITGTSGVSLGRALTGRTTDLPPTASDARLSRCALAGAIVAPFVLVTVLVLAAWLLAYGTLQRPAENQSAPALSLVGMAVMFIAAVLGLIGSAAPFATTILGVVAIGHIRRSGGKLYGLPLAVFDALVFPLLLLDLMLLALSALIIWVTEPLVPGPRSMLLPSYLIVLLIIGSFCAWLDWLIVRIVWRTVTGYEPPPKPAAANPSGKSLAAEPRGEGEKPHLPFAFVAKTALLAALAWLLVPILWNIHEVGLAIAAFAVAGLIVYVARQAAPFLPATVECWRQRTLPQRWVNIVFGILFSAGGVYFLFIGGYQVWDRLNWNYMAQSDIEFRQEYQGAEHRLLQRLDSFKNDTPRAELMPKGSRWTGGWGLMLSLSPSIRLFMVFTICSSLFIGGLMIWATYQTLLSDYPINQFSFGWNTFAGPALQLTFATLLPTILYGFVFVAGPLYAGSLGFSTKTSVNTQQDISSVVARFERWAKSHNFMEGDYCSWELNRVPQGGALAHVELRHLWRPNVFDRWQMSWTGLRRAAPDIALEIIGDANEKQTVINLYTRSRSGDDPMAKTIREQLDSLQVALQEKKPLPGTKPFELIAVGEGSASEHLKMEGVFFHVTPDQPGLAWATIKAFDQPARPAFLMLMRHGKRLDEAGDFPHKIWTKPDEGGVVQTLQVDGRTIDVKYSVNLNLDDKSIESESVKIDNQTDNNTTLRSENWLPKASKTDGDGGQLALLLGIDLTVKPAQINQWQVKLPAELTEVKTRDQLREQSPAILELLKELPQVAKFLGVSEQAKKKE